jgi:hypothetical protein
MCVPDASYKHPAERTVLVSGSESRSHVIKSHIYFEITVCYDAQIHDPKVIAQHHGVL